MTIGVPGSQRGLGESRNELLVDLGLKRGRHGGQPGRVGAVTQGMVFSAATLLIRARGGPALGGGTGSYVGLSAGSVWLQKELDPCVCPVSASRDLRLPRTLGDPWRQLPAYFPRTAMSGNGNAAATAVSPEPVTLASSGFRTSGATIGPKLPPSVVYWSGRLSLSLFFSDSNSF